MGKRWHIGTLGGLDWQLTQSTVVIFGILALLFLVVYRGLGLSWLDAILAALATSLMHWALDVVHHLGHASAARRTGFPMQGVRFWAVLGTSVYPKDEGELPPAIHARRATGGPLASALFALIPAILLYAWPGMSPGLRYIMLFTLYDSIFFYVIGAMLPLENLVGLKTDGDVIVGYLRE